MIDFKEIEKVLRVKKSQNRLARFTDILNEALSSTEPVFDTGCFEEDCKEFWYLMRHAEFLWNDAVLLLRKESYASSVFFAIVAIEEIGKLSVARFQIAVNQGKYPGSTAAVNRQRKNPLYSHQKKHQLAAFSGFAVNNRADRILGLDNITSLLNLAEAGKLEAIRQNCIYSRPESGSVILPLTARQKEDAVFFCTVSGELLAEIGGFEPEEFERLLARVKEFEGEFPIGSYTLELTA